MKRKTSEKDVSVETLREYFEYFPETGLVVWIKNPYRRYFVGQEAGYTCPEGYRILGLNGLEHRVHRVAWALQTGEWPKEFIDHDDGDTSNNKWVNLREATNQENQQNRKARKNASSQYKGVSWHKKAKKWVVHGKANGKDKHLGLFVCEKEAAKAYDNFAIKNFGVFARTNFKDNDNE